MARCLFCERKSIFLRVNDDGYCKDCVPRVAARRKAEEEKRRKAEELHQAHLKEEEEKRLAEERYRQTHDKFGHEINSYFTFVPIRVSGVTYKNGRRSRQTILRNIYFNDEPYARIDKNKCVDFVPTDYEGEKAVEVWVYNGKTREQIGYIPRDEASFFYDNLSRFHSCFDFVVSGGGKDSAGEPIPWGAGFTARFFNLPGQGKVNKSSFSAFEFMKHLETYDPEANGLCIAYSSFKKKFPHAFVCGCTPDPIDANKLIINVGGDRDIVSTYNPSDGSVSIDSL